MLEYIETYRCPLCDGSIPLHHVTSHLLPDSAVRQVRIYCEHCDEGHVARFKLSGGLWILDGKVSRLASADCQALRSRGRRRCENCAAAPSAN